MRVCDELADRGWSGLARDDIFQPPPETESGPGVPVLPTRMAAVVATVVAGGTGVAQATSDDRQKRSFGSALLRVFSNQMPIVELESHRHG